MFAAREYIKKFQGIIEKNGLLVVDEEIAVTREKKDFNGNIRGSKMLSERDEFGFLMRKYANMGYNTNVSGAKDAQGKKQSNQFRGIVNSSVDSKGEQGKQSNA